MSDEQFAKDYITQLHDLLPRLDTAKIAETIAAMRTVRDNGKMVYICGNGGSSSIAAQMVVDIVKCASLRKPSRFKMLCLSDSISTLTAYANAVFIGLTTWLNEVEVAFGRIDDDRTRLVFGPLRKINQTPRTGSVVPAATKTGAAPVAVIVTNFTKKTFDEVTALFAISRLCACCWRSHSCCEYNRGKC